MMEEGKQFSTIIMNCSRLTGRNTLERPYFLIQNRSNNSMMALYLHIYISAYYISKLNLTVGLQKTNYSLTLIDQAKHKHTDFVHYIYLFFYNI